MLISRNKIKLKFIFFSLIICLTSVSIYAQGPRINSFSPEAGKIGDTIRIKGTGFAGGTTQVKFGVTSAFSVSLVGDTLIKAVLNNGSSGYVKVTKSTGVDSLSGFDYCGTVSIASNAIQKEPSRSIAARLNIGCGVTDTYRIKKVLYAKSYNWYMWRGVNSNATITHFLSGENDTAVLVTFNSGYTQDSICVKGINACGVQSTTYGYVKPIATLNPPPLTSISSGTNNFTPCIGDIVAYTANASNVGSSYSPINKYIWTIPSNTTITSASIDSSTINLRYNSGFSGGNISVYGQTCYGNKTSSIFTAINYLPPTPSNITSGSGVFNICRGYIQTFFVTVDSPGIGQRAAAKYRWTIPANTQIIDAPSDSNFITLKFGTAYNNSYLYVQGVTACGAVGSTKSAFLPLSIGCIGPVDTIYGPLELCPYFINPYQTDTIRYTIKSVENAVAYNWILPTGVNLYEYQDTTILVTVDNTLTSNYGTGRISVCGVSAIRGTYGGTASIRLYKTVPVLGSMSGPTSICSYIGRDTIINYSVARVNNIISYSWEAITPSGTPANAVEFISGIDSNVVSVKFKNDLISGTIIRVNAIASCGTVNPRSITLYRPLITTPAAIRKSFTPLVAAITNVAGLSYDTLRIRKVTNATNYDWKLSRGTNATITHLHGLGINDTAIVVNVLTGFTLDTVAVAAATDCDKSSFISLGLSATALPPAANAIAGTLTPCIGDTITFTASAPAPTSTQSPVASYKWTIPSFTQIISGSSDSSSIRLKFNTGYVGGSLSVRTASAIGVLSTLTYKITFKYAVATPTSITSSTGSANACIGQSITYTAVMPTLSSVQAPAVKYIWTKPNFTTITASSVDSQSITLSFTTGYTGGNLTVKGKSACGIQGTSKLYVLTHTGCALGTKISPINTNSTNGLTTDILDATLFPNPTINEFNLEVNSNSKDLMNVKIFDLQGRLIKTLSYKNVKGIINIGKDLKSGTYFFEINQGKSRKILKGVKL